MGNRLLISKKNSIFHIMPYCIFTGFVSGIAVSLYTLFVEYASHYSTELFNLFNKNKWYILLIIAVLAAVFIICTFIVRLSNVSRGSGVPQALGILRGSFIMNWWKGFLVMFVCSVTGTLAGLSLGSEGPSMIIGGLAAMGVSRLYPMYVRQYMVSGGVGAGLAVAFNAPFSGTLIAMEEGHKRFSPVIMFNTLLIVFVAVVTSTVILGERTIIPVTEFNISLIDIPFLIIAGVLVAFGGLLFNFLLLNFKKIYKKLKFKKVDLRYLPPFVLALVIGILLLPANGGGAPLIKSLISNDFTFGFLISVLIVKLLYTTLCTSSGLPGGIFVPMLAVGAVLGATFAKGINMFTTVHTSLFVVGCMVAFFTSVSHSIITAVFLAVELTGNPLYIIPALIVCGVAKVITILLKTHGLYDTLLAQIVKDNTNGNEAKELFTVFIQKDSFADGKKIKDLILPTGTKLISHSYADVTDANKENITLYTNDMLTFEIESLDNMYVKNTILALCTSKNRDDELDGKSPNLVL